MDRFGKTAAINGDSAQSAPDGLIKREKNCLRVLLSTRNGRTPEVVFDLYDAHVCIIYPVRDITHMRKCTRPSPT